MYCDSILLQENQRLLVPNKGVRIGAHCPSVYVVNSQFSMNAKHCLSGHELPLSGEATVWIVKLIDCVSHKVMHGLLKLSH